jgi:D-glycero-D-manno-heptose 1,7-bisphosphate phosphatase
MRRAVFLDRDGVLIEDVHLLTKVEQVRILPGVAVALCRLTDVGFKLIVVSNQTVVSRGLATEGDVVAVNERLQQLLLEGSGPTLDGFYVCPHHPKATLSAYRSDCQCRKPRPGMLLQAAREHGIDLGNSFMIGDRITDIIAGAKAGCRTVLVHTGQHAAAPIETVEPIDPTIRPDYSCSGLNTAADWIVSRSIIT